MLTCCFRGARVSKTDEGDQQGIVTDLVSDTLQANRPLDIQKETSKNENQVISSGSSSKPDGRIFQLSELAAATMNFKDDHCLGEGAFGNVYKGRLESTNQIVAIKRLHCTDAQGHNEFLLEALMMSLLHHPNVIDLIGYCTARNERILVFEYLTLGSLEDHLHKLDPNRKVLDWNTRMRIAIGAAKGLEYLHDQLSPPIIHRDVKSSNILLDEGYHPKICDFGMAKLGPTGDDTHVSTRVMGTCGYCAPEYVKTGRLTTKSDIYSFGVVLLELITGRKAIDISRPVDEYSLVVWALRNFKNRDIFPEMVDPKLEGKYPTRDLYRALDIAQMYLHERPSSRPVIAKVVAALSYLASKMYKPKSQQNLKASSLNELAAVDVTHALSSTKSNTYKEKEE